MKKTLYTLFTAIAIACMAFGVMLMTNASVAKADVVSGATPTFSSTKYLKSTDETMMIVATGINNYQDCYELGYEIEGAAAVTYDTAKYYTSISLNGGENVWTAQDLFPGYTGMVVWEIEVTSPAVSFKAYARVGDRDNGELVETETVEYGTAKEVVTNFDVHTGAQSFAADTKQDYYFGDSPSTSGVALDKVIVIDVKFTDDGNFNFYLNQYNVAKYCGSFTVTSAGAVTGNGASIESIDDGWYRVKINLGEATKVNDPAFISRVNILNTTTANGFVMYMGYEEPDIHEDKVGFAAGTQQNYYFGDSPSTSGVALDKIIIIDVKFTDAGNFKFYLNEYDLGNYCGSFTVTSAGAVTGNGASIESIDDGWYRVKINLGEATKVNDPAFISRVNIANATTANGFVMYMGYEEPEEATPVIGKVMLTSGFNIMLPDYDPANVTTLEFDVYVTEERSAYAKVIWNLYDASNNYFGFYRVTYSGPQSTNASGYSVTTVSADNIIHVTFVLSELAGGSGTVGKLVRLADNGQSARLDGCWIDNIEFN